MKRPPYLFLSRMNVDCSSPRPGSAGATSRDARTLANLGYEVEWRVVNAADYGFPQKRRRVLLIGRLAGPGPRDPDEVLYRGTLARALPVTPGPRLALAETFRIDGNPSDVSEVFGAGTPSECRLHVTAASGRRPGARVGRTVQTLSS
jgi:DNA (cytosine-5)-methyltransferase 1